MPGSVAVPDSSEALMNKSLHLSHMEFTPSLEMLIFSYPLLSLEPLALVDLTSISPSKSLEKAANLLYDMNKISCLKKLVLKDTVFRHPNPQNIISVLLHSSSLNHVEIEHVDIGPGGLVASLVNKISRLKELCVLKLVQLDLGKQSEQLFHQLCVTILSVSYFCCKPRYEFQWIVFATLNCYCGHVEASMLWSETKGTCSFWEQLGARTITLSQRCRTPCILVCPM